MSVIVQKFGGTSVADMDRIRSVADRVESAVKDGHKVTVVVSAMAGVTNQLVEWVREAANGNIDAGHDCEYDCEYDSVVSTGEQVTSGLLACVLQGRGIKARSWLGWQLPVHTEGLHSRARITAIETEKLVSGLDACEVQVVAGFQGIDDDGRIATLGRGGSDITAVALAA
ncbi:MAG: aspartate kinase, partial [Rhodospirillales bacterium]|nr:aspartate kinase [Rhodospirillales bacterium]